MSKIQATRLINISYNKGNCRISDEVYPFHQESTLIRLRNGGGKSVLVQLLIAPFVHKKYRNAKERPFVGFFQGQKPSFIMVEWALDGGAGYVLTGMMVRKSQERDNELDMITFISEYREACPHDIYSLAVVERNDRVVAIKSYGACKKLFESLKAKKGTSFYWYDMEASSQARQYFDKLAEYGIHSQEWEAIIKKINEEEAGLSKLFDGAKDETSLLEKWVLPTIEKKLSGEQDRMKSLQETMQAYLQEYQRKQDTILRGEGIKAYQEEAGRIREGALGFLASWEEREEGRQRILAYLAELKRLMEQAQLFGEEERKEAEEAQRELLKTLHEQYSDAFYQEEDTLAQISTDLSFLKKNYEELSEEERRLEREKNIQEMAERQSQVEEARGDLLRAEEALSVRQAENAQLEPERLFLGYLIKQDYEEKQDALSKETAVQMEELEKKKGLFAIICQEEKDQAAREVDLAGQKGQLSGEIRSFEKLEQRFCKKWELRLQRTSPENTYPQGTLEGMQEELSAALDAAAQEKKRLSLMQEEGVKKERASRAEAFSLEQKIAKEEAEKLKAQAKREDLERQRKERLQVMKYVDVAPEAEFDTELLLRELQKKADLIDADRKRQERELDALQKELSSLQTGKNVTLSPELEELFRSLGINLVYGLQWLERAGLSPEEKKELLHRHPFLPYSLLLLQEEVDKIRENISSVTTSFPVPIVVREHLYDQTGEVEEESGPLRRSGGTFFYLLFNEKLLDEESLEQYIALAKERVERKEKAVRIKEEEFQTYVSQKSILQNQTLTREEYEGTVRLLSELEALLTEHAALLTKARDEMEAGLSMQQKAEAGLKETLSREDALLRKQEALHEFAEQYASYEKALHAMAELEAALLSLAKEKERTQRMKDTMERAMEEVRGAITELKSQEKEIHREMAPFLGFAPAEKPESLGEEEFSPSKARARYVAITEQSGRELMQLEEERSRFAKRLASQERGLKEKAGRLGLTPKDWEGVIYQSYEVSRLEQEKKEIRREMDEHQEAMKKLDIEEALSKDRRSRALLELKKACGEDTPLPREELWGQYEQRKKELTDKKIGHEAEVKRLADRWSIYDANYGKVSEFASEEESKLSWEEDLTNYGKEKLSALTAALRGRYSQAQERTQEEEEKLTQAVEELSGREEFAEEFYQKPTQSLLASTGNPRQFLEQMDLNLTSFQMSYASIQVDIQNMEEEKKRVIGVAQEMMLSVHEQIGRIDANSTIQVRGRSLKMLRMDPPKWDENCSVRLRQYIEDLTRDGVEILTQGGSLGEFLGRRLSLADLYGHVISGLQRVKVQIYKVEENREVLLHWREVAKNSGGEGLVSAFILLCALLHYMRSDELSSLRSRDSEGKVVLMDNPFGKASSPHLLKPLREIADKNNVQLICLTDLGGEAILNRFNNCLALALYDSSYENVRYLKLENPPRPNEVLLSAQVEVAEPMAEEEEAGNR